MLKKFRLSRLNRKMEKLLSEVVQEIKSTGSDRLEYGNIRRGNEWFRKSGDAVTWTMEVDLLSQRPMVYTIRYDMVEKEFSCLSRMGSKNQLGNLLQFETHKIADLDRRLRELARNIPGMRERMIREYLYSQAETRPRRRWLKFFTRASSKKEFLQSVAEELYDARRISRAEADKALHYIESLI